MVEFKTKDVERHVEFFILWWFCTNQVVMCHFGQCIAAFITILGY